MIDSNSTVLYSTVQYSAQYSSTSYCITVILTTVILTKPLAGILKTGAVNYVGVLPNPPEVSQRQRRRVLLDVL
jgi:hypothetical protein